MRSPPLPYAAQLRNFHECAGLGKIAQARRWGDGTMHQLQSALGVFALLAFAWAISENGAAGELEARRRRAAGHACHRRAAAQDPAIKLAFALVNRAVDAIAAATRAGTGFVFGYVGGGPPPFASPARPTNSCSRFQALPIVLVMSVLTTLLFHWRILPPIVRGFSWLLERMLGVGGAVGPVDRRQYLPRHGRIAAVHPPLSGAAHARRIVHGDDRRHGRHRRYRVRALCDDPAQRHPRGRRPYSRCLHPRRAGGAADQHVDGAGRRRRAQRPGRDRDRPRRRLAPWMPSCAAPRPGSNCCSTLSPC